jgi:UDP-N-acetylmuramoyl-tripeptide--D-alanyl-D-alanine ligase
VIAKFSAVLFILALLAFGWRRILAYLRYFQQEEYNRARFLDWLKSHRAYDKRGSLVVLTVLLLTAILPASWAVSVWGLLGSIALLLVAFVFEGDPRKTGKVKLNMTQRASKIAGVAFGMYTLVALLPLGLTWGRCCGSYDSLLICGLFGLILVQSPPWLVLDANRLLWPFERRLQESFVRDAKRILAEMNPFVIGITGSYGKTGAKAALGDLLTQCLGATFWPKKSINTVLGTTRAIREDLRPYHRFAVMEMGAYNIGSIKKLCDLTPPKAALVTAVGIMHLERFGSPENVYTAKSELAQSVPSAGILVCNGDNPGARRMAKEFDKETTLLYGMDSSSGHLDCLATDISFDDQGTTFIIHWKGKQYPGRTPLLGRPALSNALGAFTMACALGAEPAYATACMANLQPVDNRLVLDRKGSVGFLRDAYNSNPTGFQAALEVLGTLPATRRILMTPGMIELGDQQFDQNKRVAAVAAGVIDLAIIVGTVNKEALLAGLAEGGFAEEKIIAVDTRDEAFRILADNQAGGDLVLIENDLGDIHEGAVRF